MTQSGNTTRREFFKQAAAASAAFGFPYIIPSSALGLDGATAPSERIVMGFVGVGGQGRGLMGGFLRDKSVQVSAVCDVDARRQTAARDIVNQHYGNQDCFADKDFRKLVSREDIDAICVATPDHWHALVSIASAKAGKDIYCEKPLADSVAEGRAICKAVEENKRILQTGTHERSGENARFACELVRNGRIGKLHTIRINLPCDDGHHKQAMAVKDVPPATEVPADFDYDFWLGHTPVAPYNDRRCHFWWRFNLAYGGGEMTDRGAHVIDIAQLGAGMDDTGPTDVEARGARNAESLYNAFWEYEFQNVYENGVRIIGESKGPRGLKFEGDKGSIFIHIHGGRLEAEPASLLHEKIDDGEIRLGRSPGHQQNFLDCVRSRETPVAPAEAGHRTATICHLNNIAMIVGRKLKWDPKAEQIMGDDEANRLLSPEMRSPWQI